jgi:hypothetical protein
VQSHIGCSPDSFCVVYGMHYLYFIPYALVCTALIVTCKLSHVLSNCMTSLCTLEGLLVATPTERLTWWQHYILVGQQSVDMVYQCRITWGQAPARQLQASA